MKKIIFILITTVAFSFNGFAKNDIILDKTITLDPCTVEITVEVSAIIGSGTDATTVTVEASLITTCENANKARKELRDNLVEALTQK